MFFKSQRGPRGPHILLIRDSEAPIRLDEARLAAWAKALGQERASAETPPRRPHRGMLPDVDFSRAVRAPRKPGLIARLFRLFAGRPRGANTPAEAVSWQDDRAADDGALGEAERKAYVWILDRIPDAVQAGAPAREKDRSRAA